MSRALLTLLSVTACGALAQGKVTPAAPLKDVRQHHTATLLKDGRVLVVGGRAADGLSTLASCELFDPKKNKWSACAPLSTGRSHHTATALSDGKVLVVGGSAQQLAPDGTTRSAALSSGELYDPKLNKWSAVPAMNDARNGHTATLLLDGTVLVVGGAREQRLHLNSVERFDPLANTWTTQKPLDVARWLHAAVRDSEGNVLVLGGRSNAAARGFSPAAPPAQQGFSPAAPPAQKGIGPGVSIPDVERFEVKTQEWKTLPPMSEPRQRTAVIAEAADARVDVIGGQTATSSTNYAETWAPGAAEWKQFENNLSMSLSAHTGTRLPSGDIVVIGGEPPNAIDTSRVQRWVVALKQWCLAGELLNSRKFHSATLLDDGRVLVVGGTSGGLPEKTAELWSATQGKCEEPPGVSMGW